MHIPGPRERAKRRRKRRSLRREREEEELASAAFLYLTLSDEEWEELNEAKLSAGSKKGKKNITRQRKEVESMFAELGNKARRSYRMSIQSFLHLHDILEEDLKAYFSRSSTAADGDNGDRAGAPNGRVPTKLRLSAAIRFFAGGDASDLVLTHGMGYSTLYESVWGVVDVINQSKHPHLQFNEDGASFPSHEEQREIAEAFERMSGAGFDNVIGAVDGMLVWTIKPPKKVCDAMDIGQMAYHCYRKDKYGVILLAICDDKTRFRWIDIRCPGRSSDYLAWLMSTLPDQLDNEEKEIVLEGMTIVGDNAFVENNYMAIPFPGNAIDEEQDAYNFYMSQLRITIERAFGILIHRWGILRRPLGCHVQTVPALVQCLCRLHNFCIDHGSMTSIRPSIEDQESIQRRAWRNGRGLNRNVRRNAVALDELDCPAPLLGGGHHFKDVEGSRRPVREGGETPMRSMFQKVKDANLLRPPVRKRGGG